MSKATLTKHRIREIFRRVESGRSVEPEGEIWTLADAITVAGVLMSFTMQSVSAGDSLSKAGREKPEERLKELQAAVEFVAVLATAERTGTWDEYFEPTLTIGVAAGRCAPLSGFKS